MHQTALKTTQLGHTGLEISRVGCGAWLTLEDIVEIERSAR